MKSLLVVLFAAWVATVRAETMVEVSFMDQPADGGGYVTRYLVTERYLRMDYGQDRDDFVLFDRVNRVAYNVVHEARQILLIEAGPVVERPRQWEVEEDLLVEERGSRTFDIKVNGKHCSRVTASPSFLPDVAHAMVEFNDLMAGAQSATWQATPAELRHPCDLARLVLDHRVWYRNGLPVYEADADGFVRRLLNYQAGLESRKTLFALPRSYQVIRLKDLQASPDGARNPLP
jgi:hypothetical protein